MRRLLFASLLVLALPVSSRAYTWPCPWAEEEPTLVAAGWPHAEPETDRWNWSAVKRLYR